MLEAKPGLQSWFPSRALEELLGTMNRLGNDHQLPARQRDLLRGLVARSLLRWQSLLHLYVFTQTLGTIIWLVTRIKSSHISSTHFSMTGKILRNEVYKIKIPMSWCTPWGYQTTAEERGMVFWNWKFTNFRLIKLEFRIILGNTELKLHITE